MLSKLNIGDKILVKRNDLIYSICEIIGELNTEERADQIFVKDLSSLECKWVKLEDIRDI